MPDPITCFVCVEPCVFFGVFECSHFACGFCAIRIYSRNRKGCPVCRKDSKSLIVTSDTTLMTDQQRFDIRELEMKNSLITDRVFNVKVDGEALSNYVMNMHAFLCPFPKCWQEGEQLPFKYIDGLRKHLIHDHNVDFCDTCLEHRPAFLCEQTVYSKGHEMKSHVNGTCVAKDPLSFTGHPSCDFCQRSRFYDSDQLVSHMNHEHFRCHICDSTDAYTYVFFKDRQKLLNHFTKSHILCTHADCVSLDPMCRVFRTEIELAAHTQQRHGNVRQNGRAISLDTLGFVYGSSNISGGRDSGRVGVVVPLVEDDIYATGENLHSTRIIFNHVNTTQSEVILDASKRNSKESRQKKSGNSSNIIENEKGGFISKLPKHYESKKGFKAFDSNCHISPVVEHEDGVPENGVIKEESNDPNSKSQSCEKALNNSEGPNDTSKEDLSVFAMVDRMSIMDTEVMKTLPTDERQLNRMLMEKINQFFSQKGDHHNGKTNEQKLRLFTQASQKFIEGKSFATEYYKTIEEVFNGGHGDMMGDIFPLIAATVPNKRKQEALLTARRMLTCNEIRQEEQTRKEAKKKNDEERQAEIARSSRMSVLNKGKNKNNSWSVPLTNGTVSFKSNKGNKGNKSDSNTVSQLIPGEPFSDMRGLSGAPPTSSTSGNPWSRSSAASAGSATATASFVNPTDFPSLDSAPPLSRSFGNKNSNTGRNNNKNTNNNSNPWFNRR